MHARDQTCPEVNKVNEIAPTALLLTVAQTPSHLLRTLQFFHHIHPHQRSLPPIDPDTESAHHRKGSRPIVAYIAVLFSAGSPPPGCQRKPSSTETAVPILADIHPSSVFSIQSHNGKPRAAIRPLHPFGPWNSGAQRSA